MEYIIKSRSITVVDIVEYTKEDGSKVTITVPIFDPANEAEEVAQIEYRGSLL